MSMRLRRLVLASPLLGVALGVPVALIGHDDERPAVVAAVEPLGHSPSAADPQPLRASRVRIAVRAPDPTGGVPWAVRTFSASHPGGRLLCAQLGRIENDEFGWIAPGSAFRRARFNDSDVPTVCDSHRFLERIGAQVISATLVTDPHLGTLRPAVTVTWGHAAPGVDEIGIADGATIATGADGAFLHVEAGETGASPPAGELRYRDGRRRAFPPRPEPRPFERSREQPIAVTRSIAVRAPDPAGGPPWAIIAARGRNDGTCLTAPGRLIGTRLGRLDPHLGLFQPDPVGDTPICNPHPRPTRRRPAALNTLVSSMHDENPAGTNHLRRLERRTVLSGRVHRDVVALTIRTSRDVRTLIPSRVGRAIIAVYDGTFPGERITVIAELHDGDRVTQHLPSGA